MKRANAYAALAQELERWRSKPASEVRRHVGAHTIVKHVIAAGESIQIDVTLHWIDADRTRVHIHAIANGPSHWRLERLEESIVVSV